VFYKGGAKRMLAKSCPPPKARPVKNDFCLKSIKACPKARPKQLKSPTKVLHKERPALKPDRNQVHKGLP